MRISIITPTRNRADRLGDAIESVLQQGYPDFEHLIVDGLSTDDTPALTARYPHLRVIREADRGLYDALNKGLCAATGEVIGHLNDDDVYCPGAFARVAAGFADPAVEVVSGGADILDDERRVIHHIVTEREIALSLENVILGAPLPNARFLRRRFYDRIGEYDPRYAITADRDFFIRASLAQPCAVTVEHLFYEYRSHPGSLTFGGDPERDRRWREEQLTMAERLLSQTELPAGACSLVRAWHRRETAHLAAGAFWAGRWSTARADARRGWLVNRGWPLMFLRHLPSAFLRR